MMQDKGYRLPAEWEPQSMVQLTWPHAGTDWAPMLNEIEATYQEMALEIAKREPLLIVAPSTSHLSPLTSHLSTLTSQLSPLNCHLSTVPSNDTWARDHGFITLVPINHQSSTLLLDFCFNGWGEKFPADLDNAINRHLYDKGAVGGEYVPHLDFVLEGGSIESDGKGTVFTTTGCLLAPHRNQPLTKDEIEVRLKEYLCADRILWIDHGALIGDDTDGHIDTLVRICPNDTLLYIGCGDPDDERLRERVGASAGMGDETSRMQYEELRLMEEQLRTFRTIDGRPYRLMKLPMPHPIYDEEGDRLPATYANFLIINGAVLVPTYAQPDLDQEALRIVGEAFPDREIVGIDCRSIIRQHGSLHCCTMQFPEGCR